MRQRDPSIKLIGWGDRGSGGLWAPELLKRAGEHIDMVAMHMMGQSPRRPDTVLKGLRYQKEPERAWEELIELTKRIEERVTEMEGAIAGAIVESRDCDYGGAPQPEPAQRESDPVRVAVGGVPRKVLEYLPAARRAREDRYGGGF